MMVCCVVLVQALPAQAPQSAREKVEQRLADLLAPRGVVEAPPAAPNPPPRKPSPALDQPEVPLASATILPPAPPKPEAKLVLPRMLPEDTPFVRTFNEPAPPETVSLPVQPLIRLWSWHVNDPLPLPILATAVRDRASLADPSLDASIAAAKAKIEPVRKQPVPFQAANLPDPFEHANTIRLRNPLDENPAPPLSVNPLTR
ncbi:MAG: hypothetical protein L0Y71_01450 [Gemmataceae bacterium]|nr:hypothetical protein [Gemmataceae bacterium]